MLLSNDNYRGDTPSHLDSINNYYEGLVFHAIHQLLEQKQRAVELEDGDYMADVACVALNHLPPRYIRHNVDMMFYQSPEERAEMDEKVMDAVKSAIDFVDKQGGS